MHVLHNLLGVCHKHNSLLLGPIQPSPLSSKETPCHDPFIIKHTANEASYLFFVAAEIQKSLNRKICQRKDCQRDHFANEKLAQNFFENFGRAINRHLHHRFDDSARRVKLKNCRHHFLFFAFVDLNGGSNVFERSGHLLDEIFAKMFAVLGGRFRRGQKEALHDPGKLIEAKFL